jgi:myo-inositol-1(or 4)-monophosphatase
LTTKIVVEKCGLNVDKKNYLERSLAIIMVEEIPKINAVVGRYPQATIQFKQDGSPVTDLDLFLSSHIELVMEKHFPEFTFYSEEKFSDWSFPLIALDPLDGTREYIEGRDEWALSIGIFRDTDFKGEGWIYNPKTGECFEKGLTKAFVAKNTYRGEVSRSEWKTGLFKHSSEVFEVTPVGSIAYKLGRLSQNLSDFVVSLRPKNIWDIAGGTILCQEAGLKFYSQGKEVTRVQKSYEPPLIWCHEKIFSELSKIYS